MCHSAHFDAGALGAQKRVAPPSGWLPQRSRRHLRFARLGPMAGPTFRSRAGRSGIGVLTDLFDTQPVSSTSRRTGRKSLPDPPCEGGRVESPPQTEPGGERGAQPDERGAAAESR